VAVSTVRLRRTDPAASAPALAAAWLIDALAALEAVRVDGVGRDTVMLELSSTSGGVPVHELVQAALAEPRFAGWQAWYE